jgi:hypothetical protein
VGCPRPSARPRASLPRPAGDCHGPLGTAGPTTMPPIEDQRRSSVTYARTSAFSELDHQLIGHPSPNVGPLPTSRLLTGQSGVRPDTYADCSQDDARTRPGQYRNRRNQSDQVVVTDRAAGLLLDRRSYAHHVGHGHWLGRVPVWVRRLQLRYEDSRLRYEDSRCGRAPTSRGRSNHGGRTVPQTADRTTGPNEQRKV